LFIIYRFHVVEAEKHGAAREARIVQEIGTVNALQQDGKFVFQQFFEQFGAGAGTYYIGQFVGETFVARAAWIIKNALAVLIQFGLFSAAIFKTVQPDAYPLAMQRPNLIKEIKNAPVIRRVGNIMANNMEDFVRQGDYGAE
jgi:hypothetical protein